jgi:serine/threonine protein kinase
MVPSNIASIAEELCTREGYTFQRHIGSGGNGSVFHVNADVGGSSIPCALKLSGGQEVHHEAMVLARLRRESAIIETHGPPVPYHLGTFTPSDDSQSSASQELYYVLLEYIPGVSLRSLIKDGKTFSCEEIRRIGIDITATLSVCAQKEILHHDLKPTNIMISTAGVVRVLDFGASSMRNVKAGHYLTPWYAAPERILGDPKRQHKHGDLFSLGVILYELFAGRHPYQQAQVNPYEEDPVFYAKIQCTLARQRFPQQDLWASYLFRTHRGAHVHAVDTYRATQHRSAYRLARIIDHLLIPDPAQRFAPVETVYREFRMGE